MHAFGLWRNRRTWREPANSQATDALAVMQQCQRRRRPSFEILHLISGFWDILFLFKWIYSYFLLICIFLSFLLVMLNVIPQGCNRHYDRTPTTWRWPNSGGLTQHSRSLSHIDFDAKGKHRLNIHHDRGVKETQNKICQGLEES